METHSASHLIHKLNWPPALVKSLTDQFEYELTLKTGRPIFFTHSTYLNDEFVKLHGSDEKLAPRGIELRVSEIAYVIDAPHGIKGA